MTDRRSDHAEDLGLFVDRVPAIQAFDFLDRRLTWRGRFGWSKRCEGKECAELLRQYAAHQAGFAHAQRDRRLLAGLEDLECFNVVADRTRKPCNLVHV